MTVETRGAPENGPCIVCLHGISAHRGTWHPVARRLEDHNHLLLLDLLGRGDSDPAPRARYDLETEAARVARVLQVVGIRRPVLAGHSHGAAIAMAAARRVEARGLVLFNPVPPQIRRPSLLWVLELPGVAGLVAPLLRLFRRPLTRYMLGRRVFAEGRGLPEEAVRRYASPWRDARRARGLLRVLADWRPDEVEAWTATVQVPVEVFAGARDRRVPPRLAQRWTQALHGRFHRIQGCGHSVPEEAPATAAAALRLAVRRARAPDEASDG